MLIESRKNLLGVQGVQGVRGVQGEEPGAGIQESEGRAPGCRLLELLVLLVLLKILSALKAPSKELECFKMPKSRRQNPWNEVVGLAALGIGTVVFLALISYNTGDIPSWVWFSYKSPPNDPSQNCIGPTVAIGAGYLYLTLGAAAYLVASLLLGFGVAKLFLPGFRI